MDYDEMLWNLAERAYTAYRADSKCQSYNGRPIPEWLDVQPKIQKHWVAAVTAIARPDVPAEQATETPRPGVRRAQQTIHEALNRRNG